MKPRETYKPFEGYPTIDPYAKTSRPTDAEFGAPKTPTDKEAARVKEVVTGIFAKRIMQSWRGGYVNGMIVAAVITNVIWIVATLLSGGAS